MRHVYFAGLFVGLAATLLLSPGTRVPVINHTAKVGSPLTAPLTAQLIAPLIKEPSAPQAEPKNQARILDSYGKLPLSFEANHGQSDGRVKFLSRSSGYALFLTQDEAVLALRGSQASIDKANTLKANSHEMKNGNAAQGLQSATGATSAGAVLRMKLRNANPAARVTGMDELAGTSNYFIGNDPKKWRSSVPTYAKVKYEEIYSGIDLVYYGNQQQLEYDFIVAPGADPRRIAFDVRGAQRIRQDERGDLVLKMSEGEIRWHKPVVYQEKDGTRQEIAARYAITATNRVAFEVAKYDASKPLYIDPLIYSTYLGGSGEDIAYGMALDGAGNAYVTGSTSSTDFPTMNPLQAANAGGTRDAFVAKINAAGSALLYSTYLGGSGDDIGFGIAVDGAGNAYITGSSSSSDFPTVHALQPKYANGPGDAFVTKINPTGSALLYSTYLGGSDYDQGSAIAVDSSGNAYVSGFTHSANFPTKNPLQPVYGGGLYDAFVTEINAAGSALVYSTYLGGSGDDLAMGIVVDSGGNAYFTGQTSSTDFPTKKPLQAVYGGGFCDAFVTEINAAGSALVYSTYLGGSAFDAGHGITVDNTGNAYVTGNTGSPNFPTKNPLLPSYGGGNVDAFVSKISPAGTSFIYSTYLGGAQDDGATGIAADGAGNAYVTGATNSGNFPIVSAVQAAPVGPQAAFVTRINPTGSAFFYSTYLGGNGADAGEGIAVDSLGNAYVAGSTGSTSFPTMNPLQAAYGGGGSDAFVAKLSPPKVTTTTLTSSSNPSAYGMRVTFTATVSSQAGGTPTSYVKFLNGTTILAWEQLGSSGTVSFTTSTLPLGSNSITAAYIGDSNFTPSTSAPVNQVVLTATTTTLSSSLNPSIYGQAVTFTATVTSNLGAPPNGETVTFMKGTTTLGTVALSGGSASFTSSTLPAGTYNIKAVYGGDANLANSTSKPVIQTVNKATTTTTLSSSQNPSSFGQAVTFTAHVAPQFSGTVNGQVTFKNGTTVLATMVLSSGVAKYTTSKLPVGTNPITATYNGNATFVASTSNTVNQVVK